MTVLVACEFSAVVRDAFIAAGHSAISCDLRPCERADKGPSGELIHFQGDVRKLLARRSWDLLIAHPPCTYLTNAGARWLYQGGKGDCIDERRWSKMLDAARFFNELLNCGIPRVAIENPIMHAHARELVRKPYSQIIHPWQHGHAETKATCIWLQNLPQLVPSDVIAPDLVRWPRGKGSGYEPRVHFESPGKDREKNRSRTLEGVAKAMAEQWGRL